MNKKKVLQISIKVIIILVLITGFILLNDQISQNRATSFFFVKDSCAYAYQIEDVKTVEDELVITGWFFEAKKVRNSIVEIEDDLTTGILLYDINSEIETNIDGSKKARQGIKLTIKKLKREDINKYFSCEYDYSDCGFVAKVDKSLIDYEKGQYQIVIKPNIDGTEAIDTSAFLDHGELKYINPKDEMILNVKGTDLEKIVMNGYCLISSTDFHVCLYQYEGRLYWITDNLFPFEEDGTTSIQYQVDTTQFDKLPEQRTSTGWYWDNLSGYFESFEVTQEMNTGGYRVCVRDIPKEYSITAMVTGCYQDGQWIWEKWFRPISLYK